MTELEKTYNVNLPKWPQMLISGSPVTPEQAKEIIFRTDAFLTDAYGYNGGNNIEFNEHYRNSSGLSMLDGGDNYAKKFDFNNYVKEKVGFIELNYVPSDFASSCFVGGPDGFCSPDGEIKFSNNVGKWPSAEVIYEDLVELAEAFPFLEMKCTLMDGESCEENTKPVISFDVCNGVVCVTDSHLEREDGPELFDTSRLLASLRGDLSGELGLPKEWYAEYITRLIPITEGYLYKNKDEV